MYRTEFWTLWEKVRVGCSERTALKQVYYQVWSRSPAQVGCMRQVLGPVLGRPRGMGWGGRQEGGSGWGTHVNPWLIHVNVEQKPLQYCKVISLQLIKINEKNKKEKTNKKNISHITRNVPDKANKFTCRSQCTQGDDKRLGWADVSVCWGGVMLETETGILHEGLPHQPCWADWTSSQKQLESFSPGDRFHFIREPSWWLQCGDGLKGLSLEAGDELGDSADRGSLS